MTLQLGGGGAITGCTSLADPVLTLDGLVVSGTGRFEDTVTIGGTVLAPNITLNATGEAVFLGNVGIGTSSPDQLFHISSGANTRAKIATTSTAGFGQLYMGDEDKFLIGYGSTHPNSPDQLALRNNTGDIFFATGTSSSLERVRIDSSGRVGIGTTTPTTISAGNTNLTLGPGSSGPQGSEIHMESATHSGSANGANISYIGSDLYLVNREAGSLRLFTDTVERLRIDSLGRLLVGTSTARNNFFNGFSSWTPQHQIETAGSSSVGVRSVSFTYGRSNGDAPIFAFAKHRSDSIGGTTVVQSGDGAGVISFQASDGTDFVEAANISALVDGTPGANDMPGRLVFSTTADGASSPTERLRIDSSGSARFADNVKVGTNFASPVDLYGNNDLSKYGTFNDPAGAVVIARNDDSCLIVNQKGSSSPAAAMARFQGDGVDCITLFKEGSASFSGQVGAIVNNASGDDSALKAVQTNVNGYALWIGSGPTAANRTAYVLPDGTASFKGDIYVTADNITASSIYADGAITLRRQSGTSLRLEDTSANPKIRLNADGSAEKVGGGSWSSISSARRLKDIVGDVDKDQAWGLLKNIDLKRYYYKTEAEADRSPVPYMGLIAEDAAALDPELKIVTDQTDDEGEIWSYNMSVLQMKAWSALSAALTRIEALEAEVASLRSN